MKNELIKKIKSDLTIIFIILLFLFSVFFLLFSPNGYLAYRRVKEKYEMEVKRRDILKRKRDKEKMKVEKLKKDPDAMREEIEKRYNVLPENGKYIIIKLKGKNKGKN